MKNAVSVITMLELSLAAERAVQFLREDPNEFLLAAVTQEAFTAGSITITGDPVLARKYRQRAIQVYNGALLEDKAQFDRFLQWEAHIFTGELK